MNETNQPQEQSFGIQLAQGAHLQETAATSRAASATALVQARCVMAMQRPRDWDTVRTRLLKECERPGFAEVAMYRKPIGGGKFAEGHSIRFAEAAMRNLSNFHLWSETIYNDTELMTLQVTAMDLETNVTSSTEVTVQKTVERSSSTGRVVIAERTNSSGNNVFIVLATEDEIRTKVNSELSKARRGLIMQLLPGDIADDCEEACKATQRRRDKADPDAAKKKLFDAFSKLDISPTQLKAHLGHANAPSPAELQTLREIYAAISTGETTWAAVTEDQRSDAEKRKADAIAATVGQAETATVVMPETKQVKREPAKVQVANPDDDGRVS
jgi:hypothetical protein